MTKAIVNSVSVASPDTADGRVALPRTLGTLRLAVFVIAAVAPLAAVIGVLPVALVFGSGTALPLAFVVVTAVMALFAVGFSAYVAMAGEVDVLGQVNCLDVWNHDRFSAKLQREPYTDDDARALAEFGI